MSQGFAAASSQVAAGFGAEGSGAATPEVTILAPAKLNLSLAVLARRSDGFHEIESLMVPVTLHDTLRVRRATTPGVRLRVRFGGELAAGAGAVLARDVPTDSTNLVVRAALLLADEAGVSAGLDIDLVKEIPSGAGLGGGSSDAAAALLAAARVWQLDWPADRIAALGSRIGSDVPWFFAGGPAIASGRGERIDPLPPLPPLWAVVACPRTGLSTAAVYGRCTPEPARAGEAHRLAEALGTGGLAAAEPLMHNSLERPARDLSAEVDGVLAALAECGGFAPLLTGSGSACFALARTAAEARGVAARLAARHVDGRPLCPGVFVVRLARPADGGAA